MLQSTPTSDLWERDDDDRDVLADLPGGGRAMLDDAIAEARDSKAQSSCRIEFRPRLPPLRAPKASGEFSSCNLCVFGCYCFSLLRVS